MFSVNTKVKKGNIYSIFIGFLHPFVMAAIQAYRRCAERPAQNFLLLQENNFSLAEHGAWH
jgi:hypothetical protein